MDTIKPVERNWKLGLLADAIQSLNDFGSKPFGYDNPPVKGLLELAGVPSIAKTIDRLSYGFPITSGKGWTTRLLPETTDALLAAVPAMHSAGKVAEKGAEYVAKNAGPYLDRTVGGFIEGQIAKNGAPSRYLQDMARGTQSPVISQFHNDVLGSLSKGIPDDATAAAFGHEGFVYHTPYRPFENAQATAIGGGSPISERVFSTQKPLTAAQLKSIEALPVSDGATNAFAKELADEGAIGFLNKDGKRFSVVTPSAKNQGQYQATQYDPRGAIGDSQHETSAEAIRRLMDGGYSKILDERRIEGLLSKVMLGN